jgi:predicted pyridoxine 5'-phosphate oxidase superfamily flavin-nucleotide-binding protein
MEINTHQKQMVETLPLGVATVNEDGSPNLIVVLEARVISGNKILITDNYMKQTVTNLQKNSRVTLGVWTNKEGYKFIGEAEYHTLGKWLDYIKNMPENKGEPAKGAILVTVEKIIKLG